MRLSYKGEALEVLVDGEDAPLLAAYTWHIHAPPHAHTYYVIRNRTKGEVHTHARLHRLLLNAGPGQHVDHINGNGLDNRRGNLRLCTRSENLGNRRLNGNSKSGIKGVYWAKDRQKWRAEIQVRGEQIRLGQFLDLEEAKAAYVQAALKYFGEFANVEGVHEGR